MSMNRIIISSILFAALFVIGCSKDEPHDIVNEIKMSVSAETGTYIPWGSDTPVECMLVMSEDNPGVLEPLAFGRIEGFTYEKDYSICVAYVCCIRVIRSGDKRDMERFADGGKSETGNRFSFSA